MSETVSTSEPGGLPGLDGRTAIVTGAGSGIGRATACDLAQRGVTVVVVDLEGKTAHETVEQIAGAGGRAIAVQADVTARADMARAVEVALSETGQLNFALNNAGRDGRMEPLVDVTDRTWDRVVNVNLKGVWLGMINQIPAIIASGGGSIVNMASTAGLVGFRQMGVYAASKHGVLGLTRTAALEYAQQGLRVNAVCPSATATPMLSGLSPTLGPDAMAKADAMSPMGRRAQPDEIANAVAWLFSSSSSFVNGVALPVDGGLTAQSSDYPPNPS